MQSCVAVKCIFGAEVYRVFKFREQCIKHLLTAVLDSEKQWRFAIRIS